MDVIQDFVEQYRREFNFYERLSELCESECQKMCESAGIKAIFSHRAKAPDALRAKLTNRQLEKLFVYVSAEEIRSDVVDLAGTRIALYFPGDQERIDQLIGSHFNVVKKIVHSSSNPRYRFPGYRAVHYRVQLPEALCSKFSAYGGEIIEIQVASVFMHAWAEVEHDLTYKSNSGAALSDAEYQVLDQLNGLAHTGELALIQLGQAIVQRTLQTSQRFRSHYELASFILNELTQKDVDSSNLGAVDVLYDFLRYAGLHSADHVHRALSRIQLVDSQPVAGLIVAFFLEEDPAREKWYRQALFRVVNPAPDYYYVEPGRQELGSLRKGCLIKGSGSSLYWYSKNDKRYVIPNKQTFDTWFPSGGSKPAVKFLDDQDLVKIPIGGNVTYRPGTRLVKIATDPKVYAIGHHGVVRWLASDEVASQLFGSDWREASVDLIADAFFVNYSVGYRIDNISDYDPILEKKASITIDDDMASSDLPVSEAQKNPAKVV